MKGIKSRVHCAHSDRTRTRSKHFSIQYNHSAAAWNNGIQQVLAVSSPVLLVGQSTNCSLSLQYKVLTAVAVLKSYTFWDHHVARWKSTDILEEDAASIFRACLLPTSCWFLALAYSFALKMEMTCSSETLVAFQRTTRRHIPGDGTLLLSVTGWYFLEKCLFRTSSKLLSVFFSIWVL
jgi:hypothetical protein